MQQNFFFQNKVCFIYHATLNTRQSQTIIGPQCKKRAFATTPAERSLDAKWGEGLPPPL